MMSWWFYKLLKVYTETFEKRKHFLLKNNKSNGTAILAKSKMDLELVSSYHNRARNNRDRK